MLLLRLLLVAAFAFVAVSGEENDVSLEITDDEGALVTFMSLLLRMQWDSNKAAAVESLANVFRDVKTNITIIASSKTDKSKRIELYLPPNLNKKESSEESEEINSKELTDEESIEQMMNVAKTIYEASEMNVGIYAFDIEDGIVSDRTLITKDFVYNEEDVYFGFYNFTLVSNKSDIQPVLDQFKSNSVPPTIIHLDVDGKFVEEGSVFPPINLFISFTSVTDHTPENILKTAQHLYSKFGWQYTEEELPKALVEHLNKQIPEYRFAVSSPDASYSLEPEYSFRMTYYSQPTNDVRVLVFKK